MRNSLTFMVAGQQVVLTNNPIQVMVTLQCSFPKPGLDHPPTPEQNQFVVGRVDSIVNYMYREGFLTAGEVPVTVRTIHPH